MERNHLRRLITSSLLAALLAGSSAADLRNPRAWDLFLAFDRWDEILRWGDELVAADEDAGLFLYDPALRTSRTLTTRDGLPSNRIASMMLDGEDHLWVGLVDAGAARISPSGQVSFVSSLIDPHVQALASDGNFVVYGTPNGAGPIVGGSTGLPYTTDDGLISNDVRALAAHAGVVWFGGPAGVTEFDRAANNFVVRNDGLPLAGRQIQALRADATGVVAATNGGVFRYDSGAQSWSPLGDNLASFVRSVRRLGASWYAIRADNTLWRLDDGASSWVQESLNAASREYHDVVADASGTLWLSGTMRDDAAMDYGLRALLSNQDQSVEIVRDGVSRSWIQGISSDRAGGFWVGNAAPNGIVNHIQADGTVVSYDRLENLGGDGLCERTLKIDLQVTLAGNVWVSSFQKCQTRILPDPSDDPILAGFETFDTNDDSPLNSRFVDRIHMDERGRLWFASTGRGSDAYLNQGVDVLKDPAQPNLPESWLKLSPANSQLARETVRDVATGPGGVVWFALDGYGLQRWDSDGTLDDGSLDSFDDPLYWTTVDGFTLGGFVDFQQVRAVAVGADGSIWAGTTDEGLIHFRFSNFPSEVEVYDQSSLEGGMLSGTVLDVIVDRRGHAWAATDAGLNRIRRDPAGNEVDAWTTLSAFETRQLAVRGFSTDVLSPLPSPNCNRLDYDETRDLLFLSTAGGAVRIRAGGLTPPAVEGISLRVYPNPARGETSSVFVTGFSGEATVNVFDIEGNPISALHRVRADIDPVWDLRDRTGAPVASGLYIVQVVGDGGTDEAILAVER